MEESIKEELTGEEEWKPEVLNDPRNRMRIDLSKHSPAHQRRIKDQLKLTAPPFSSALSLSRRASLASSAHTPLSRHPTSAAASQHTPGSPGMGRRASLAVSQPSRYPPATSLSSTSYIPLHNPFKRVTVTRRGQGIKEIEIRLKLTARQGYICLLAVNLVVLVLFAVWVLCRRW